MRSPIPVILCATAILAAQARAPDAARGVSGYVLSPEGTPVAGGSVIAKSLGTERAASIGSNGRFRIEALAAGTYDLSVSASPWMTHAVRVTMPPAGSLTLPPIVLAAGSHLRFSFLAPGGAPVEAPQILRASYRLSGERVQEYPSDTGRHQVDSPGVTVIGPLPPGMTVLAVDTPPYARMRLRDIRVTGESPLIDAGTVILQPGAVLTVSVVDAARMPVSGHAVVVEEGLALSPLWRPPVRTDLTGNATFDRLASGQYYVRTFALERCGGFYPPAIARSIAAPPRGGIAITVVVDGRAKLRLMMDGSPVRARSVSLTPESPPTPMPLWLRADAVLTLRQRAFDRFRESSCLGATDDDGRVTFAHVPPGPARVAVRVGESTWVRRLELAGNDREVVLQIPSGLLPVRVVDAGTGGPVGGALITWSSGGAQVEALSSVTGEALLQGVATRPGVLTIEAPSYRRHELKLTEPPDVLHDVALKRSGNLDLQCRVVTDAGGPLAGAVVELTPHDRLEVPQVTATDGEGIGRFPMASSGPVRLVARAERYAAAIVPSAGIPIDADNPPITMTLSRGYRIIVTADRSLGEEPHAVRVLNQAGVAVDEMLDARSDRVIQPGGRVTLGLLPRGSYVVELRTGSKQHREAVIVDDRDVHLTMP